MRLALVGPVYPFRGGIAHYTTMLHQALREQGHQVLLVTFKRQYPAWLFPGRSDRDPSKEPLTVPEARRWLDSLNPLTWLTTFGRIRRQRPDALVLQWWTTFWAPVWLTWGVLNRLFLRKPLIYICHNVLPHEAHAGARWLTRLVLRQGHQFVVQSPEEEIRLRALVPQACVRVVPLPPFDMFVRQRMSKGEARSRLELPADAVILLFFGMVREYKGLIDMLRAMPALLAREEKTILVVAGEFWDDKRPYLEVISQLGISDWVLIDDRYIPNEEVAVYFSAADALVAPYHQLTGSAVMQMAKAFRLPIHRTISGRPGDTGSQVADSPGSSWDMLASAVAAMATPLWPMPGNGEQGGG